MTLLIASVAFNDRRCCCSTVQQKCLQLHATAATAEANLRLEPACRMHCGKKPNNTEASAASGAATSTATTEVATVHFHVSHAKRQDLNAEGTPAMLDQHAMQLT